MSAVWVHANSEAPLQRSKLDAIPREHDDLTVNDRPWRQGLVDRMHSIGKVSGQVAAGPQLQEHTPLGLAECEPAVPVCFELVSPAFTGGPLPDRAHPHRLNTWLKVVDHSLILGRRTHRPAQILALHIRRNARHGIGNPSPVNVI